ncbi:DNA mismatch repair protein MutS [Reichenbachiella versicolor]|uniref:DNA mismatch repair protein MutS n=1 Tax=Reichenbachiella versicolor TaxID=1821036 RepID=UPI001FE99F21|nr:DNA mismatch repair protein MutS [Reichenbachiella versicolor]
MKQYNAIKAKHPDAMLLFRVGDFYETFGEDAVKASKVLDIVLTKRANGSAAHIELAGFPHHSLDTYLPKLVRAGNRVAICDQLENPKDVKGIVKRGVTELVTPGLTLNDNVLDQKKNNYLASICFDKKSNGIAFLDLSTGEFMVSEGDLDYIDKLIQGFKPSEIIYCKNKRNEFEELFGDEFNTFCLEEWIYGFDFGYEKLQSHFQTKNLKGFGIEESQLGIAAAGAVLHYLEETEHKEIKHISAISRIDTDKYVWLDKFTIRNLELAYPAQPDGVPLISILDHTQTPMGARLLKKWMVLPLKDKAIIDNRLNAVESFIQNADLAESTLEQLSGMTDIERLASKVAALRVNPRELLHLRKALEKILPIIDVLGSSDSEVFQAYAKKLDPCVDLVEKLESHLKEELPLNATQGNIIADGINEELDELRKIAYSGKDFLLQIQEREKERTGISSLKIAYNKVFGYYLEVSNAHKDKVPEEWIRKQTLVNAERYITEELKVYEEKILGAEDKLGSIEFNLFQEIVQYTAQFVLAIQGNAKIISEIDCLLSFSTAAQKNNYCRPTVKESQEIDIKEGRHPVIETQLPNGEEYVPNSIFLDDASQQIIVITGPNMAGKSALLRQTALIVLMAQMGSFVPAAYAKVGIIDKVFTRVGASDNLSKGESTFMVEMTETASILNNLSENCLVLMDEIGRGTSTYDGVSIAWSIVEHLHNHPKFKGKTMFATHYHELNQIAEDFPRVKNFNVSVKELDNRVIFMRKLKEGGSEHSFGIHVAQMAGMPNEVVIRANEILHHLEKDKIKEENKSKLEEVPKNNFQLSMFGADPNYEEVLGMLNKIDVNTISPVEALLKLNEIKNVLKGK